MPKTNSKSKIQTLLGDKTSAALSTHGWRKNTENPSVYGIEKPFNEATVLFYFNLYNKTNYSVFPFQKIIFNDLTSTLTNALPTLAAETDLTVCISDTFYTFENLPVLNASSDLPAITNLFSGQILACETAYTQHLPTKNMYSNKTPTASIGNGSAHPIGTMPYL